MKIFEISVLTVDALMAGLSLGTGHYIAAVIWALGATYWFVKLVKTKARPEVALNISDEAKELLKNNGIKIVVNRKEVN